MNENQLQGSDGITSCRSSMTVTKVYQHSGLSVVALIQSQEGKKVTVIKHQTKLHNLGIIKLGLATANSNQSFKIIFHCINSNHYIHNQCVYQLESLEDFKIINLRIKSRQY